MKGTQQWKLQSVPRCALWKCRVRTILGLLQPGELQDNFQIGVWKPYKAVTMLQMVTVGWRWSIKQTQPVQYFSRPELSTHIISERMLLRHRVVRAGAPADQSCRATEPVTIVSFE